MSLQLVSPELRRIAQTPFSFGVFNVKWYGATGDNATLDTAGINAAIAAATAAGGGTIYLPPLASGSSYRLSSTITLSASHLRLVGGGADGVHDSGSGSVSATILGWYGSAGDPMIIVSTPSGSGNSQRRDIHVENVELDGRTGAGMGIHWTSVGWGGMRNVYARDVTVQGFLFDCLASTNIAEAANNHRCIFENLSWRMIDTAGVRSAHGLVFTKASTGANTSFSTFINLFGQTYNGDGIHINDAACDNCQFISTVLQIVLGTGKGMSSFCDSNVWLDYSTNGGTYYYGTASGGSFNPTQDLILMLDLGNGTAYPTLDTGCQVSVVGKEILTITTVGKTVITDLVQFPATQVPSSNANTLDDYEEGTFTPTMSFSTAGTSSWAYGTQTGSYTKIGRRVFYSISLSATPTIGTGAGNVQINGLPFTVAGADRRPAATSELNAVWTWPGGGYTEAIAVAKVSTTFMNIRAVGSALAPANFTVATMTGGSAHTIEIEGSYEV